MVRDQDVLDIIIIIIQIRNTYNDSFLYYRSIYLMICLIQLLSLLHILFSACTFLKIGKNYLSKISTNPSSHLWVESCKELWSFSFLNILTPQIWLHLFYSKYNVFILINFRGLYNCVEKVDKKWYYVYLMLV